MGPKRKKAADGESEFTGVPQAPKKSKGISNREETLPTDAAVDNSALHFFKNQHYGSKGIRAELKRAAELGPFRMEASKYYQFFEAQAVLDPLRDVYQRHLPKEVAHEWLWLGTTNSNILVHGVGDKGPLLQDYIRTYLHGEDVLELSGNPITGYSTDIHHNLSIRSTKAILVCIAEQFLKLENAESVAADNLLTFARNVSERLNIHYGRVEGGRSDSALGGSGGLDRRNRSLNPSMPKWKGRYAHCQDRLYIIIHELCGSFFENFEVQKCFSILGACESVSVVASVETLNLALTWDADVAYQFDWKYFHIPTYVHHKLPLDHPIIGASSNDLLSRKGGGPHKEGESSGQGLDAVLDSLTNNHRDFLSKVCKELVQRQGKANEKPKSDAKKTSKTVDSKLPNQLSFSDAFAIAGNALIVRSKPELKTLIAEYIDHKVLELDESNSQEIVRILLSEADIKRLAGAGSR